jgi:carboxylesterase type B
MRGASDSNIGEEVGSPTDIEMSTQIESPLEDTVEGPCPLGSRAASRTFSYRHCVSRGRLPSPPSPWLREQSNQTGGSPARRSGRERPKDLREFKGLLQVAARFLLATYKKVHPNATPIQLQARMLTDRGGRRSASTMVDHKAALAGAPAYLYVLSCPSPGFEGKFGSVHGTDVGLSFHNARQIISGNTPQARKMADMLASVWVAFAKTGNPNGKEIPNWPAFTAENRETMIFDTVSRVENDPWREIRLLWNEMPAPPRRA